MSDRLANASSLLRTFSSENVLSIGKLVLEPAFQPIVEISSGRVFGFESLMRGHDRLGFSSPAALLDAAHDAGQLDTLESMMAARACARFASLADFRQSTLFLNWDVRLFARDNGLVEQLTAQLAKLGIPASSICFELSERFDNAAMADFGRIVARMRKEGFKLAFDDFGTGHGELAILSDLALDYIKIDRHFISGIDQHPRKRQIVKTIVSLAHTLGTKVIAEGVEQMAEVIVSQELGVDLLQGYFLSRPTLHTDAIRTSYPEIARAGLGRRGGHSIDGILIRKQVERLPFAYENDTLESLFELFRQNPGQRAVPVLNVNNEPRGIIHERQVKEFIYHPFGRDLLQNRIFSRGLARFTELAPTVDLNAGTEELMASLANHEGSECVILTENMRYAGVISATSLVRIINQRQLERARNQNPLTGLPGNHAINDFLRSASRDPDAIRHFCYCDFDYFKPFNDAYGFHVGDHAIALFAALMRRYFFSGDDFLGHIGGDDFFIGSTGRPTADIETLLNRLLDEFHKDVLDLFTDEDRQAGRYKGVSRNGEVSDFPILRCSIGVLTLPAGLAVEDLSGIAARIAKVKSEAKQAPDCLVVRSMAGQA